MKTIIGVLVLGGVVTGVVVLNGVTKQEDGKSVLNVAGEMEIPVETATPKQGDIVRSVQAPGAVEPISEVEIRAEVVAKILEMPVDEGSQVRKNDLLCRLDDADFRARVLSAEANVAKLKASTTQAEAELEKAQRDFDRQIQLSEASATSTLELADYHTTLIRARSAVEIRKQELVQAEAALQSAREDLAKTVIESPIDGVVSQLFAKQGEVVVTGTMNNPGTRIMVVSDLSKMQIRCRVDETDAPLVQSDQPSRIFLQSDTQRPIAGHVFRVASKGTKPQGRDVVTFETLVIVDGDDPRVKPGMTANVEIEVARKDGALTVPVQAVVNRRRRDLPKELTDEFDRLQLSASPDVKLRSAEYIKVLFRSVNGVAHPTIIETGITDETNVEIVRGVSLEDVVVTGPYRSLDQLKDGSKVKVNVKPSEKEPSEEAQAQSQGKSDAQASAGKKE